MTTMDDVARAAGVSGTTVSHVLNHTRPVNDETRRKVEEAIRQTGYRHNSLARALAAGRTQTIGLCVPIRTNPYIADLVNAIESAASSEGYTLLIGDSQDDDAIESRAVNTFLERRVDGVIMAPTIGSGSSTIPQILESKTPLVLIDRRVDTADCDQVFAENMDSTRALTRHLLDHGYTRIAVVRGKPGVRSTDDRLLGVRSALDERGLSLHPDLLLTGNANANETQLAVSELVSRGRPPEAIITLNNAMTIGAVRALTEHPLRIPDDVALAGFDDFEWADIFVPRLTTVAQDVGSMGRTAVRMLTGRINGEIGPGTIEAIATSLKIRDSCGRHPTSERPNRTD